MTEHATRSTYDVLPYPSAPRAATHPGHLAALATLHGLAPADVERCRVLEIGTADGGNLIPIAYTLGASQFVGIDASRLQIEMGRKFVDRLKLSNVELRAADVREMAGGGEFDYIIVHGVFSWVDRDVQESILAACRQRLAEHGVAMVSYNTYPGWHLRGAVRRMMQFHTRGIDDPLVRAGEARRLVDFLTEAHADQKFGFVRYLEEERAVLARSSDSYVFHEHLEDVNEPCYFHEFVACADRHGLRYVCEAESMAAFIDRLPPATAQWLSRMPPLEREQYLDFFFFRTFRESLLCRADAALEPARVSARLDALYFASSAAPVAESADLRGAAPVEFRGASGVTATISHALTKTALAYLKSVYPLSVRFDELLAEARRRLAAGQIVAQVRETYERDRAVAAEFLLKARAADIVEVSAAPPRYTIAISDRPVASAVVRAQAETRRNVATLRHTVEEFDDVTRLLIRLLDGRRDRHALVEALAAALRDNQIPLERHGRAIDDADKVLAVLEAELRPNLERLAQCAVLEA